MVLAAGAIYLALPPGAMPTPPASPTGAPSAISTRLQAPTQAPTRTTNLEPTPINAPSATETPAGDAAQQLLRHVPEGIRSTCTTTLDTGPVLARADCSADGGLIEISYSAYESRQPMLDDYEAFRLISGIESGSGNCSDTRTWPAEVPYNVGGQPAGRLLCTETPGMTTIHWTDDQLNILGQAAHSASHHARLVDFWIREAGPYP